MDKITHFSGQPLLSQLLKFVNKQIVLNISREGGCNRYTKMLELTNLMLSIFCKITILFNLHENIISF